MWQEGSERKARDYLMLPIASGAYEEALKLFSDPELQLQDRFRPVYYALLYFLRDQYPLEYNRIGSEMVETVQEVIAAVEQQRRKYFAGSTDQSSVNSDQ